MGPSVRTFVQSYTLLGQSAPEPLRAPRLTVRQESHVSLKITQDLHVVRAHQIFYASLLDDFRERVEFIRKHENPAMTSAAGEKNLSKQFLERECDNLKLEITRLNRDLAMQEQRLKNMINLVSSMPFWDADKRSIEFNRYSVTSTSMTASS
jgi:hypothetical protein